MTLEVLHDRMLECMPEGASHPTDECPFCNQQANHESNMGGNMSKTYSEEEVQALVTAAVADATKEISEELADLRKTKEVSEVEAQIAQAKADAEEKVKELQAQLDAAVIEAAEANKAKDEILSWLESENEAAAREAELATLREERVTKVAEVASFPEEYLSENADRWASMTEEDFEAVLADYRAVTERVSASEGKGIPEMTALTASRESAKKTSVVKEVLGFRNRGIDPRYVR